MGSSPAERARKCFAVAKSQDKFPAERDSAIRRGLAILESAGLDPDDFDIPGRVRKPRPRPAGFGESVSHGFGTRRGPQRPFYGRASDATAAQQAEAMQRAFREAMNRTAGQGKSTADAFRDLGEQLRGMRFDIDEAMWEAIREAMARRHSDIWRGTRKSDRPTLCPHGHDPRTTYCFECQDEAEFRAGRRCRHGREQCPICGELDGFGRI